MVNLHKVNRVAVSSLLRAGRGMVSLSKVVRDNSLPRVDRVTVNPLWADRQPHNSTMGQPFL
jgi:hypothetical protein